LRIINQRKKIIKTALIGQWSMMLPRKHLLSFNRYYRLG
jgi:hypothetical protein